MYHEDSADGQRVELFAFGRKLASVSYEQVYSFVRCYKWLQFEIVRYPMLDAHEFVHTIAPRARDLSDELQEYRQVSTLNRSRSVWLLIMILFAMMAKTLILTDYDARRFDMQALALEARKSRVVLANQSWHQFACIVSNCTKLTPLTYNDRAKTTHDEMELLAKLPMLTICRPELSSIVWPYSNWGKLGQLALVMQALIVYLCCIALPIFMMNTTRNNESLMFAVAPRLTRRILQERARRILVDSSSSYLNFRIVTVERSRARKLMHQIDAATATATSYHSQDALQQHVVNKHHLSSAKSSFFWRSINAHLDDCISIVRNNWWRKCMAISYASMMMFSLITDVCTIIAISVVTYYMAGARQRQLGELGEAQRDQQCSMRVDHNWRERASMVLRETMLARSGPKLESLFGATEQLNLDRLDAFNWTMFIIFEALLIFTISSLTLNCSTCFYVNICIEQSFWLSEVRNQLAILSELLEVDDIMRENDQSELSNRASFDEYSRDDVNGRPAKRSLSSMCMHIIESRFNKDVRTQFGMLIIRPFGLSHRQASSRLQLGRAYQSFACEITRLMRERARCSIGHAQNTDNPHKAQQSVDELMDDCRIELLEKVYINTRCLIDSVHEHSKSIAPLVMLVKLMAYALAVIAFGLSNLMLSGAYMNSLTLCFLVLLSIFIGVSARFHSRVSTAYDDSELQALKSLKHLFAFPQAQALNGDVWALVALLSRRAGSEMRFAHLRLLYTKLVCSLDAHSGLTFKAYGVRVTHTDILQVRM